MSETFLDRPRRSRAGQHVDASSPLDPFLRELIAYLTGVAGGVGPTQLAAALAAKHDWEPAFVEALFASARARGLVRAVPVKGTRSRVTWHVSRRGAEWLAAVRPPLDHEPEGESLSAT